HQPGGPAERVRVQGAQGGHAVQDLLGHQAPTRFCPHTRSVWPLMPPDCGESRNTIASATSTGCPPCCSEFNRRATCRVSTGIRAVISVSINPGATAFAVPPLAAILGAVARVRPTTPPLVKE